MGQISPMLLKERSYISPSFICRLIFRNRLTQCINLYISTWLLFTSGSDPVGRTFANCSMIGCCTGSSVETVVSTVIWGYSEEVLGGAEIIIHPYPD